MATHSVISCQGFTDCTALVIVNNLCTVDVGTAIDSAQTPLFLIVEITESIHSSIMTPAFKMNLIGNLGRAHGSRPTLVQSDPEFKRIVGADMPNTMTETSRCEATGVENKTRFRGTPALPRPRGPWKLIEGSLDEKDIRAYTRTDSREQKFWGVKSVGLSVEEFWAKYDSDGRKPRMPC